MARALLTLLLLFSLAPPAQAQRLIADLSSREIAISTGFTGAELLLFGATEGAGDIVVVVEGPHRSEVVRRKERIAGIWVNGTAVTFDQAPSYYWVAASRKLSDIATPARLADLQIGEERLRLPTQSVRSGSSVKDFRDAFIRNKQALGLYGRGESEIRILGGRLFRTTIAFPANVPTGAYHVTVFLFKNGRLISRDRTPLRVHRTGLEAEIFDFAHNRAPWYGAIAIVIALVAGWLAGIVFKRA